jgi:Concanavalin A-like lectin/glucanases superfamily
MITPAFSKKCLLMIAMFLFLVAPKQASSQQDSLVAAYAFDQGSGTTAVDSSGNSLNGTISGATWTSSGKNGAALSFNGTSSWVTVPDAAPLDLTTGATLEAWVYPTSAPNHWKTILMKEAPGLYAYALYISPAGNPAAIVVANGEEQGYIGSTVLPLNAWTHLAFTCDGTTLRMYVNGAQAGSAAISGAIQTSTGALRIGGNGTWPNEYFKGRIDDVRIYSRQLTAAEIQTDLNAPVGE